MAARVDAHTIFIALANHFYNLLIGCIPVASIRCQTLSFRVCHEWRCEGKRSRDAPNGRMKNGNIYRSTEVKNIQIFKSGCCGKAWLRTRQECAGLSNESTSAYLSLIYSSRRVKYFSSNILKRLRHRTHYSGVSIGTQNGRLHITPTHTRRHGLLVRFSNGQLISVFRCDIEFDISSHEYLMFDGIVSSLAYERVRVLRSQHHHMRKKGR